MLANFHGQNALVFANTAYHDREPCYLVGNGDWIGLKLFVGSEMSLIKAKKGQDVVFGHLHVQNTLIFTRFTYFDSEFWYTVVSDGQSA